MQQGMDGDRLNVPGRDRFGWDNPRNNNFAPMHNNTRMDIDEQVAKEITNMKEVESATVLLTDRNAYVAIVVDDETKGNGSRGDLKQKVANKVKSLHQQINNVYVSANPDFVDRMRGYNERFRNGQPLRGLVIEFNRMVERIFPADVTSGQGMR